MNKIININLAGRLIPIDEEAYRTLRDYLETLKAFFLKEEGGEEIIHDLEDRIGELFQDAIRKGKAFISKEDIEAVIEIMGRPEQIYGEAGEDDHGGAGDQQSAQDRPKRLRLSKQDKVVGGVCGGIASYLGVDPVIVRVVFALITIAWGTGLLIYGVLWAVLPVGEEEPVGIRKRLYRDPEQKVLGGVCSGIAAYFQIDVVWIRLLFAAPILLSVLFSVTSWTVFSLSISGLPSMVVLYLVLWASIPEANSAAEKLAMKGKKIDLNNLRDALKGKYAATAGPAGSKAVSIISTLLKIALFFVGAVVVLALLSAIIGLFFASRYTGDTFSVFALTDLLVANPGQKVVLLVSLGLITLIVLYLLITLLIYLVTGKPRKRSSLRVATLAILLLGSIFSVIWIAGAATADFSKSASAQTSFPLRFSPGDTLAFTQHPGSESDQLPAWIDDSDFFFEWDGRDSVKVHGVAVRFEASGDNQPRLLVEKSAFGKNLAAAKRRADAISLRWEQDGHTVRLPSFIRLSSRSPYRGQQAAIRVQVPVGTILQVRDFESTRSTREYSFRRGKFQMKTTKHEREIEDGFYRMNEVGELERL